MKMTISLRISHLSAILVLNVLIGVVLSHPLCGTMDETPGRLDSNTPPNGEQEDRIHFRDPMNVRTIDVNGTRIHCFSEATNTTDTNRSFSGHVPQTFETQINSGKLINSLALILSGLANAVDNKGPNLQSMPFTGTRRNHSAYPHMIPTRFQLPNNHQHFYPNPTFMPNDRDCLTKNQPYCVATQNYPASLIDDLIRKSSHKFESAFGSDAIEVIDIGTRNNANDEEQLCDSYEEVIYPTSGEREDTTKWFIVNTNKYQQGVRIARCLNPSNPCRMTEAFPNFYRTECKQHFAYRELVAVTPEGNTTKDKFKFPACCTCVLRKL